MPSATAWRARSPLVQWVICSPSATGSRQASSTIRARCRGGNLLGTPEAGVVQQEFFQSAPLVTAADAPDGGRVALHPGGDGRDRLAGGNGQDDAGMLDLEPSQAAAPGHRLEDGQVGGSQGQRPRLTATHGQPPRLEQGSLQHTAAAELLA